MKKMKIEFSCDLTGASVPLKHFWKYCVGSDHAPMALRWTAAAMQEAVKGFRRLKAHKQLPALRAALAAHQATHRQPALEPTALAA